METLSIPSKALLKLAKSKGFLRARDLDQIGIPRIYLQRLCEQNELQRIGRGLYQLSSLPITELHSIAEVSKRNPRAVISLLSALQIHGMTSAVPHQVWITIETHAWLPTPNGIPLYILRANEKALSYGTEKRILEGVPVRITNRAKTVVDCFRYRHHVGLDLALEALRDYLHKERAGIEPLMQAASVVRVTSVIKPYLEAIV